MSRDKKAHQFIDAVLMNDARAVRQFLNDGVQVDTRDREHQETALMLAVKFTSPEIVQMLIDAGADVNAADNRGRTALMHALGPKQYENFLQILNAGADIHAVDSEGHTALMWAVLASNELAVRTLLQREVNVNAKDLDGETALSKAEMNGFVHLADILKAVCAK